MMGYMQLLFWRYFTGWFFPTFTKCESNLPKMPNCAGYMFLKLEKIMVILLKKIQSLFRIFVFLM